MQLHEVVLVGIFSLLEVIGKKAEGLRLRLMIYE
jgi:hypothetical protein